MTSTNEINYLFNRLSNIVPEYIKHLYKDVNGFGLEDIDYTIIKNHREVNTTYGEILPTSVSNMIKEMNVNANDVFYDLGCGTGKVVIQYFLQTNIKKSVGIEISSTRANKAQHNINIVLAKFPKIFNNRKIEIIQDNILNVNLSDATCVYLCSTCFSSILLNNVLDKIKTTSKNIRVIVTLKDFDSDEYLNKFQKKVISIPCTWSDSTIAYMYYL